MTCYPSFIIHNSDFSLPSSSVRSACSRGFLIHNSAFLFEEVTRSRDFIIHNSDFLLLSSSACSQDFIIPNSHFSLPSEPVAKYYVGGKRK